MCGIVGAVSEKNIAASILDVMKRLEYSGYDAANMLTVNSSNTIERISSLHGVNELEGELLKHPLSGKAGIGNTDWSRKYGHKANNIYPHIADDAIGLVQNGLIENNDEIRSQLIGADYTLMTKRDSELVGYLVHHYMKGGRNLFEAVRTAEKIIVGSYAACFINSDEPNRLVALQRGSNLVIGLGENENFVASDPAALSGVAQRFIYLENGDIADITSKSVEIYDESGDKVERQIYKADANNEIITTDKYDHLMLKEIYDQPDTILTTLQGRLDDQQVFVDGFGMNASEYFSRIHRVQIVASGTSYHAGLVGRYWMESVSGIPCQVEHASESHYRERIAEPNTLFVTLSQSGETLETLNALRVAKNLGYTATLTIGNAPGSSIVSESDLVLITGSGTNRGGTSIKDFSAQLAALSLLSLALGRYHRLDAEKEAHLAKKLRNVPFKARKTLKLDGLIKDRASLLTDKQRALFIGNGIKLPVAMEGALKLKETSSIYTEATLADNLDQKNFSESDASIVALASKSDQYFTELEKVMVKDRKNLLVFADEDHLINDVSNENIIGMPSIDELYSPMTYIIPMQLLAYHVAISKGGNTDELLHERTEKMSV